MTCHSCETCDCNKPTEMILLVRVDYDHGSEIYRNVGLFTDDEALKKHLKQPVIQYRGRADQWYPRFEVQGLTVIS